MNVTEKTIDDLIAVNFAHNADPRAKHLFRESLRNLVRLAKAEHMLEMRADIAKVTAPVTHKTSLFVSPE